MAKDCAGSRSASVGTKPFLGAHALQASRSRRGGAVATRRAARAPSNALGLAQAIDLLVGPDHAPRRRKHPDGTLASVSGTSADGGNDRLVFNGGSITSKLDLTALASGNFNITLTPSYTPQSGDVFDLLDWGNLNGTGHSSSITGLTVGQLDLPSLTSFYPLLAWDTGLWASQGVLGIYTTVPEPSRMVLFLLGRGLMLRRRVRRF